MFLTLLAVATLVAITAVFIFSTKSQAPQTLPGETTLSTAEDASETLSSSNPYPAPVRSDWQLTTVAALHDAEELLDVLENQGFAERELVVLGNSTFAVRWR
jgi:hypothetical protein